MYVLSNIIEDKCFLILYCWDSVALNHKNEYSVENRFPQKEAE